MSVCVSEGSLVVGNSRVSLNQDFPYKLLLLSPMLLQPTTAPPRGRKELKTTLFRSMYI